jgi:hypothetical protein
MRIAPACLSAWLTFIVLVTAPTRSHADVPAANTEAGADAAYTRTITERSAKIVAALALHDAAQSNRVQSILVGQYRALNAWHDANDPQLKALNKTAHGTDAGAAEAARQEMDRRKATLLAVHHAFLARLAAELSAAQVEAVKDEMTYHKVKVTYDAYCEIVPQLTAGEKAHVLQLLKDARELAMDAGSAGEKSAIFNQFKGKINNYLTAQGHNVSQAYKDWGARQKAGAATKRP